MTVRKLTSREGKNEKMGILLSLARLLSELSLGSPWGRGPRQLDKIKCQERV